MIRENHLPWFEEVLKRFAAIPKYPIEGFSVPTYWYEQEGAYVWLAEASTAIASVFPGGHQCRQAWERLLPKVHAGSANGGTLDGLVGVFKGATNLIRAGRLGTLIDSIRVETESDLLEQAEILVNANHLAAAAVIAGGSLETHLRHLVAKHGLTITGHGSISTYNQAIAQARKAGTEVYSKADHDQVESCCKTRNDAAHNPGNFKATNDQLMLMIEGVRQFITRTTPA